MRRAAILSFSDRGAALAGVLAEGLRGEWRVELRAPRGDLAAAVAELFPAVDALIFVGACGIAVRAVAPLLIGKASDPAVVVVDELGRHAISLLSGHIGGANALARRVAGLTGGEAVITTATDVNGRFAVDEWAARRGLYIADMALAKRFAAEILKRDLPLWSDFPVEGALPSGVFLGERGELGAAVSCRDVRPFDETLLLIPRVLHLGIGCKRGTSAERIAAAVDAALKEAGLRPEAVAGAASIDVKKDEPGLLEHCARRGVPIAFYSADELRAVPGEFSSSAFVERTVGVDNVCERAAMRAAGPGARLLAPKRGGNGVTVAVTCEDWRVRFE